MEVKLIKKTIKSNKNGKEYDLYHLECGDVKTKDFFINSLSIDDFYKLWAMVGNDGK